MERALAGGRENPCYDACIRDFSDYYERHMLDHTRPFVGISEMLEDLKGRGYRLAIVSNKFDAAVKELNARFSQGRLKLPSARHRRRGSGENRRRIPCLRRCRSWAPGRRNVFMWEIPRWILRLLRMREFPVFP